MGIGDWAQSPIPNPQNIIIDIGFWLPNESGFDSTFFVKFLGKEKEVKE